MAKSMRQRYETAKERVENDDDINDTEAELILEFLDANDPQDVTQSMPDKKTKENGTLARYARATAKVARFLEPDLSEATADEINQLMSDFLQGNVDGIKEGGLSEGTVRNYQGPMRRFFMYHDDLEAEREEINFAEQSGTSVDENDMFDKEDVKALREEAKRRGSRDACLVDLLLYTGQRRSAILNLRLKDVNIEAGTFSLNEDDGDLKGASGKRPLLGALQSVRDWKRQHPTGEPDDYLITHKDNQDNRDSATVGDKLNPSTVYRQLQRIGKAAGVDKPVNAHNFRHFFTTVSKRDYGMDSDTVKHLLGHRPNSRVMETTYSHLKDDDYIEKAETATGIREPDDESPLTPSVCDRCSEPLDGDFRVCPYCGYAYTPDAQTTKETVEEELYRSKGEAKPGSKEDEAVDGLKEYLRENPELIDELTDYLK